MMVDTLLKIAYRVAPEPFAERISQAIWSRQMERTWKARVAAHIAAGGTYTVVNAGGLVSEHLA